MARRRRRARLHLRGGRLSHHGHGVRADLCRVRDRPQRLHGLRRAGLVRAQRLRRAVGIHIRGADDPLRFRAAARLRSRAGVRPDMRPRGRLPDLAAARPLPGDGDPRHRPHRLRGRGRMDRHDPGLYGDFQHSAARYRRPGGHVRPRADRGPHRDRGAGTVARAAHPLFALRPGAVGRRRQRRRRARARYLGRALQARRLPRFGGVRGAGGIAVRARGRLRQPGGLRAAHGRARLHHALCRRHRHDRGALRGCDHREPVARDFTPAQGLSRPGLWRGPDPAADLRAKGLASLGSLVRRAPATRTAPGPAPR